MSKTIATTNCCCGCTCADEDHCGPGSKTVTIGGGTGSGCIPIAGEYEVTRAWRSPYGCCYEGVFDIAAPGVDPTLGDPDAYNCHLVIRIICENIDGQCKWSVFVNFHPSYPCDQVYTEYCEYWSSEHAGTSTTPPNGEYVMAKVVFPDPCDCDNITVTVA